MTAVGDNATSNQSSCKEVSVLREGVTNIGWWDAGDSEEGPYERGWVRTAQSQRRRKEMNKH